MGTNKRLTLAHLQSALYAWISPLFAPHRASAVFTARFQFSICFPSFGFRSIQKWFYTSLEQQQMLFSWKDAWKKVSRTGLNLSSRNIPPGMSWNRSESRAISKYKPVTIQAPKEKVTGVVSVCYTQGKCCRP